MAPMPDDIMREIIKSLPSKSLARFRCVRKSWRTLISDPDLIRANLNHFSSKPELHSLLIKRISIASDEADYFLRPGAGSDPEYDDPSRYFRFSQMPYIAGSCNGLLCLYSVMVNDPSSSRICICNPSIRQWRILPQSDSHLGFRWRLGFGVHPVSLSVDDYRVIKIVDVDHFSWKRIQVYSLRSNSWRWFMRALPQRLRITNFEQSLMFNGCVHWRATRQGSGKVSVGHILYFDMANEVFGEIELPKVHAPPTSPPISCDIGVVEGCLCVLDHWDNLWVMKEYGVAKSWTIRYAIRRESIGLYLRPLGFSWRGEVILEKRSNGWLYSYDPKNQSLEDIELPSSSSSSWRINPGGPIVVSVVTYVESLVSVF